MRFVLLALPLVATACRHTVAPPETQAPTVTAPAARTPEATPPVPGTPDSDDAQAFCSAQRSENRFLAEASRCGEDADCIRAGQYETGSCDAWVTKPDAEQQLRQMRAATDAACRGLEWVDVTAACPASIARCVAGRCLGSSSASASSFVEVDDVLPEDAQCIADGLVRVSAEKAFSPGHVQLRFPVPVDGSPPRYFEAVGPHDPATAVGVARVLGWCRWRMRNGQPIPRDAWGSFPITIRP